jgi:hypothetical protein
LSLQPPVSASPPAPPLWARGIAVPAAAVLTLRRSIVGTAGIGGALFPM